MSERTDACPRAVSPGGKSLPLLHLLFFLLCSCLVHATVAQAFILHSFAEQAAPPTQTAGARNTPEVTTLEAGKALERELSGGQQHLYQLALGEGEHARLTVTQRGIDVVTRLVSADGAILVEYDTDPSKQGDETVELTSRAAGNYRLTVEPRQRNAPAGRYEILLAEIRPANERDAALHEARELNTKANQLWRADKYAEALVHAERALAIRERELGPHHADVAASLITVANVVGDQGDYAKSEAHYQRALDIREQAFGKDHFAVSLILNNLGVLYRDHGDYAKAESFYQRALDIREKTLEPDHLLIASVLNNLAGINRLKGDDAQAASLYQRTLEIREKALGAEHPDVATTLNNIANLYTDVPTAEPLYRRALAIREKTLGLDNPNVAQTLYNLAVLYSSVGDHAKAAPLCGRALSIYEKALGAEHFLTSYPLNMLANIYKQTGDYGRAESLYERSINIKAKTQGQYHPDLGGTLTNLAGLYAVKGEIEKALSTQARANAILEYNITLNIATGSERQKLAYLKSLSDIEDQTIMLHLQTAPDSAAAANLAATTVLQRKGRVLDAMSDSLRALRRRFNAQDRTLLDKLNETTAKLVGLVLEGAAQDATPDEHARAVKALESEREKLEGEISRRSAGFYERRTSLTLAGLQAAIPRDAALIEFAVHRPISPKAYEFITDRSLDPNAVGEPRYVVYVVRASGAARGRDLGAAKEIDAAVELYRQALRDPLRKDTQRLARELDEKVMRPVRALAGDATRLLVSPDGALNLIPFAALTDEEGRYLVEKYSFTYLTSGRDLLRMQAARTGAGRPLVIADPSFGEPVAGQLAATSGMRSPIPRGGRRRSVTDARDLSEVYFAPLGGAAREASAIRMLFPDADLLTGARATEAAFKQVSAPLLLHVATHGFFLQDAKEAGTENMQVATRAMKAKTKIENPLLRSGLALADANLRGRAASGADDGILTALEASGLNLWGTKLVVLSACDTGVGEVRNGEGVYGLRRAFVQAGAESLLMSLWPASDNATRKLMASYYRYLKQGMGRGESLRRVQLDLLKSNPRLHPFYWANFIQSGEWANLDGKR